MTVLHIARPALDAEFIDRINQAVAEDRYDLVDALAREYDRELAHVQAP